MYLVERVLLIWSLAMKLIWSCLDTIERVPQRGVDLRLNIPHKLVVVRDLERHTAAHRELTERAAQEIGENEPAFWLLINELLEELECNYQQQKNERLG